MSNFGSRKVDRILSLTTGLNDVTDELALVVTSFGNNTFYGSIDWLEIQ